MSNMIIVEGCDNSGKTTLIKQLQEEYPTFRKSEYSGNKPPNDYNHYAKYLLEELHSTIYLKHLNKIHDRFFFSEEVFGTVIRNKIGLTPTQYAAIVKLIQWANPIVILCEPSLNKVLETYDKRDQYPDKGYVSEIRTKYREVIGNIIAPSNYYIYDYEYDIGDVVKHINSKIIL